MKLKKSINKTEITFRHKFSGCTPATFKRGDLIKMTLSSFNNKRRGGGNFRLKNHFFLLDTKKRKKNNLTYRVKNLFAGEKVFFTFLITGPLVVQISC